jgi:L-aspartate oxidase
LSAKYDYIIVGSGIAGLFTALLARQYGSVLLITKGGVDDCNTKLAQGGIAAAIGNNDSTELHYRDTIAAGDGLSNPGMVRLLVDEAMDRVADLVNFGIPFDTVNGEIALALEAAHSKPRIIHAGGDATGAHIETTLSRLVHNSSVELKEHCLATEVICQGSAVRGIRALQTINGEINEYDCRYLILATGGAGQLFSLTTNPEVATADGVALAYHAGAELVDMEFFQFHPTALKMSGASPFLISEAVRGEGGVLRNKKGECFMAKYSSQKELAPRDIVSRAVLQEITEQGTENVFLDVTHLEPSLLKARFPQIYRVCMDYGVDITKEWIPVAPAAHYMIGGVRVDSWGESSIKNLFAAGETACTGVHGANRLASNSLLEVPVFAKRIIQKTCGEAKDKHNESDNGQNILKKSLIRSVSSGRIDEPTLAALQNLMWHDVGIVRDGAKLKEAVAQLAAWGAFLEAPQDRASYEIRNLILTARMVTEAALCRRESRGAHYRRDYPDKDSSWQKHIIYSRS